MRVLLLRKGVSLAAAATAFGWSLRKLMLVIHEWRRPRDADEIAAALGRRASELFPTKTK